VHITQAYLPSYFPRHQHVVAGDHLECDAQALQLPDGVGHAGLGRIGKHEKTQKDETGLVRVLHRGTSRQGLAGQAQGAQAAGAEGGMLFMDA